MTTDLQDSVTHPKMANTIKKNLQNTTFPNDITTLTHCNRV